MTVDYTIGHDVQLVDDGEVEYLVILEEDLDVCDPEMTWCPRKSLRQFSGYGIFFVNFLLPTLSPDVGEYPRIMPLSDVIEDIRALSDDDYEKVFLPRLREKLLTPYSEETKRLAPEIFVDMTPEEVEKEIEEMSDAFYLTLHKDRVDWFKYWAEKCMKLYGDEAKVSVS